MRELRSLVQLQQNKIASLETEAAELKLLHAELKREVVLLKVCYRLLLCSVCQSKHQGSHASWKVLDSFPGFSRPWKVLENQFGPGKSWK